MRKIVLATEKPFARIAVEGIMDIFKESGDQLAILEKYTGKAELKEVLKDADALIVRSDIVDKEIVESAPQLKIVVRAGAGYDNIDLEACSRQKIVVMNTPGQNSNAVAELAFGLLLFLIRSGFNGNSGTELRGKKLGIHAYGYVGRIVGMIGKGFGMKVYAHDPFVEKIVIENDGVQYEPEMKDLYRKCQYISLHLPLNQHTQNLIDETLLMLMPEDAVLVNTARKEIINEASLLKVFSLRKDFRYAADVIPDRHEEVATQFPGRYFFTPKKMGAQTFEANVNAGIAAARQIAEFFKTGNNKFQVNT